MWAVTIDKGLKDKIDTLPKEIQKKLYIYSMRFFWRDYVPLTAKVPTWYDRKVLIDRILYDAREQNINFMHLEFNTLPGNKRWIMGCQCEYCSRFGKGVLGQRYVEKEYRKLLLIPEYFEKQVSESDESDWNNYMSLMGVKYFDPSFNTDYEHYIPYSLRNKEPINFSSIESPQLSHLSFEFEIELL